MAQRSLGYYCQPRSNKHSPIDRTPSPIATSASLSPTPSRPSPRFSLPPLDELTPAATPATSIPRTQSTPATAHAPVVERGSDEDIKIALVRQAYGLKPLWNGADVVAKAHVEYHFAKKEKETKSTEAILARKHKEVTIKPSSPLTHIPCIYCEYYYNNRICQ
jgi:hypothetical protein